jgi:hypothetical protein
MLWDTTNQPSRSLCIVTNWLVAQSLSLLTVNYYRSHPTPGDYNFGASTHALTLRGQTAITGELALITS